MTATIKVLTVEGDDDDADLIAFALEQTAGRNYELRRARSLSEMNRVLASFQPDIVLLDLHLPDCHGLETVRRAALAVRDVPILVLTGRADSEIGPRAVEAGAQDFLPKPELMSPVLERAIDFAIQRKDVLRAAERRAGTDALTGLANSAAFTRELETAAAQAGRHGGGFALAFIDLDGLKSIGDTRGHAAGDEVLVAVAARIRAASRASDQTCRLGGNAFAILMDGIAAEDQAMQAAARYVAAIEQPITLSDGAVVQVDACLGLARCPADGRSASELVQTADARLHAGKAERKHRPRSAMS